jgi:hypothetical protein
MSRRKFMALLAGLAALAAGLWLGGKKIAGLYRDHAIEAVKGFFKDPQPAALIGEEYLALHPEERDVQLLLKRVSADLSGAPLRLSAADIRNAMKERIGKDFEEDKVVDFHGWALSATELRLCALVALTGKK